MNDPKNEKVTFRTFDFVKADLEIIAVHQGVSLSRLIDNWCSILIAKNIKIGVLKKKMKKDLKKPFVRQN